MNAASYSSSQSYSAIGSTKGLPCICNLSRLAPGIPLTGRIPISLRREWGLQHRSAASAGELSAADLPPEGDNGESTGFDVSIDVFPRLHERDPYRRLGVGRDSSFEEVQDARNYLYDTYKGHEKSRESIEMAFDTILQEKMKVRHKQGFKPPKRGRKTDLEGDPERVSILGQIKERLEPSVPSTAIVNDGSIFIMMGFWAAWQTASADPSLPVGAAICFSIYKLFDKRKKRDPEGDTSGRSHIWGAVAVTVFGLVLGSLASWALVKVLPLPTSIRGDQAGLFIINIVMGLVCIFFK